MRFTIGPARLAAILFAALVVVGGCNGEDAERHHVARSASTSEVEPAVLTPDTYTYEVQRAGPEPTSIDDSGPERPDETYRILFTPSTNQRYTVYLDRTIEERASNQVISDVTVRATAEVRVIGPRNGGSEIEWHYTAVEPFAIGAGGLIAELSTGIVSGLRVRFSADAAGQPRTLLNSAEVRAVYERVLAQAPVGHPVAEDFRLQLGDPAAMQALALAGPLLAHTLAGVEIPASGPYTSTRDRRGMLSSRPIRSRVTARLDSVNSDGIGFVYWTSSADPAALSAAVQEVIASAAPGAVDSSALERIAPTLRLDEEGTFEIDARSGLVRRVEFIKTARVAERTRAERTSVTTVLS
ncbi:hypothetical protein BH23BAC4_BH23BAC4_04890 [soil metagenome]